jgi:2',3'-cyclic-nucleotide 2'-phosphodiesterase (5'-nucleotidase family)
VKGIDLMTASNHYLALENEVIEMYLQRMNPDLLVGNVYDIRVICCFPFFYLYQIHENCCSQVMLCFEFCSSFPSII